MTAAKSSSLSSSSMRFITELTQTEKRDFLNSFDLVFCDCDGVIWYNLFNAIPGVSDAITYLRNRGKQVIFVTNNSISSTKDQLKKFASCNLHVEEHELIHPAKTISDYLKSVQFEGLILCFSTPTFKDHLRESGFQVAEERDRLEEGSVVNLRNAIYSNEPVKAIVFDIDFNLTAWRLMKAQFLLKNPECLFLAGAADPRVPFGGHELIGPGAFIRIVEEASQRKAKVFGKPGAELAILLKSLYNIKDPRKVLMIGDSLKSDIQFGKMCGFQTLFVLTGGVSLEEVQAIANDDEKPDFIIDTLANLNGLI